MIGSDRMWHKWELSLVLPHGKMNATCVQLTCGCSVPPLPLFLWQFVNHVFNSHQLSNKALLTGHLGFQHDHLRRLRQPQELFDAPAAPICGADSTEFRSSSSSPSSSRGEGCSETNRRNASDLPPSATAAFEGALDAANPESFFPRCWDVSDDSDGLSSMLRGFAVSAAVALLRTAVQAQARRFC